MGLPILNIDRKYVNSRRVKTVYIGELMNDVSNGTALIVRNENGTLTNAVVMPVLLSGLLPCVPIREMLQS